MDSSADVEDGTSGLSLGVAAASALPKVTLPTAGKRRDPESGSASSDGLEPLIASSLAIVPFTPFFFCGWESYSLHTHVHVTKETTIVQQKATHS